MGQPSEKSPDETLRRLAEEIRVWREEALRGPEGLDDRTLAAYVSGELDGAERDEVEGQLAGSPELEEMVGVVRETLEDGDWQAEGKAMKLDLRPPLFLTPAPAARRKAARRYVRIWWLAPAAAAVLLAVAVSPPFTSREGPANYFVAMRPPLAMRVHTCILDEDGQVLRREPLPWAPGRTVPANLHFQVEITGDDANGFCLLYVDPVGKVESLYDSPRRGAARGEKLILPSATKAYRFQAESGLGSLVLARTDSPQELLAGAQGIVDEIAPPAAMALSRTSLAKTGDPLAMARLTAQSQPHSRPATRQMSQLPPPSTGPAIQRVRSRLAEDQVTKLLHRLKRDYDVKGLLIIQHRSAGNEGAGAGGGAGSDGRENRTWRRDVTVGP